MTLGGGSAAFTAVNCRNGMRIFPSRIFRLTRVTRIFQKSVFTEITRARIGAKSPFMPAAVTEVAAMLASWRRRGSGARC